MNPLPNCAKFINDTLRANTGVVAVVGNRVYNTLPPLKPIAPNTVIFPCVVFSLGGSQNRMAVGENETVYDLPAYFIKAVITGEDFGGAHEVMNAVNEALKHASGTVNYNGRVFTIQGLREHGDWTEYADRDDTGNRYNYVGMTYRLFVTH